MMRRCNFNRDSEKPLSIWAVYERPKDYPNNWVARRHEAGPGWTRPTGDVIVSISLEDLRGCILAENPGLVRLARALGDDPVIVETWL